MIKNMISENCVSQIDTEGNFWLLLYEIIDHSRDYNSIRKEEVFFTSSMGYISYIMTTKIWQYFVKWKDGSLNCISLKDLKDSYLVKLFNFSINNNSNDEPYLS